MNSIQQFFSGGDMVVVVRLLVAVLLAAIVGFERERSGKSAGLRTHMLVGLGSAVFTIVSLHIFSSLGGIGGYDYHLVANIIVGIGFIGAGAIMKRGGHVEGITTAASLWVVAALGIASGFGFFVEAVAAAVIAYLILSFVWRVERRMAHWRQLHPDHGSPETMDSEE